MKSSLYVVAVASLLLIVSLPACSVLGAKSDIARSASSKLEQQESDSTADRESARKPAEEEKEQVQREPGQEQVKEEEAREEKKAEASTASETGETKETETAPRIEADITYSGSSKYKPQAASSSADVELVYIGRDDSVVPQGVSLNPDAIYMDRKVSLESDYPTADQPHVMVGEYTVRNPEALGEEALEAAMRERAAKDGADVVFIDVRKSNVIGLGVYLSEAAAVAVERKPAETLLEEEASMPKRKGYTRVMTTTRRALDSFEPVTFQAERGTCYWLTFALAEDAAFSSHARKALGFKFDSVDYDIAHSAGVPTIDEKKGNGRLERSARSGTTAIGCPQKSGELSVDLQATFGSARSKDRIHDLGEGDIVFRIHTKSISRAELAERKKASEEAWEEAEKQRNERNRRICRSCAKELGKCGDKDPRSCTPYTNCIKRRSGRVDACL